MLDLKELVKAESRYYKKENPLAGQTDLFGNIVPKRKVRRRKPKENAGGQLENRSINQTQPVETQAIMSG